jgi:hypothetical protein
MIGIMMSMRTTSMSGVRSRISTPSWPLCVEMTSTSHRSSSEVRAKTLRMSSSTTSAFLPARPVPTGSGVSGAGTTVAGAVCTMRGTLE